MRAGRAAPPTSEHPPPLHSVRPAMPPRAEDAAGFARVLRRRDFRYLWAAQCASQLAQNFIFITLLIDAFALTGKALQGGAVTVAFTFPGVLLSAPAGVYADRHDKRALMMFTNLIRGGLLVIIPLLQIVPPLRSAAWPLLLITLLFSSAGQVFAPAEAASIPSLVSREQIQGATSLFMTTVILTIVLGSVLASVSVVVFGLFIPFYIAAGLFAIAAFSIWRIRTTLRAVEEGKAVKSHVVQELREGLGILGRSPLLRWGMIQLGLALIVVFSVYALGAPYMKLVLDRSPKDTFVVLVPATLGLVAMAGVLGQHLVSLSRRALLLAALVTCGACLVALGIAPTLFKDAHLAGLMLPLVVLLALIFGVALGAILIPAFTVLQEGTTEDSRGRIFGGVFTVINAATALPVLLAAGASDLFGSVAAVLGVIGAVVIVTGLGLRLFLWDSLAILDRSQSTASDLGGGSHSA